MNMHSIIAACLLAAGTFTMATASITSGEKSPKYTAEAAIEAASQGQIDLISIYRALGCDFNETNAEGVTALMSASEFGKKTIVSDLLVSGAEVNLQDKVTGGTALHRAVSNNHIEVAEVLLANGADVNIRTFSGETPLVRAQRSNYSDMVRLLEKAGGKH